jgi:hypothetical protein
MQTIFDRLLSEGKCFLLITLLLCSTAGQGRAQHDRVDFSVVSRSEEQFEVDSTFIAALRGSDDEPHLRSKVRAAWWDEDPPRPYKFPSLPSIPYQDSMLVGIFGGTMSVSDRICVDSLTTRDSVLFVHFTEYDSGISLDMLSWSTIWLRLPHREGPVRARGREVKLEGFEQPPECK